MPACINEPSISACKQEVVFPNFMSSVKREVLGDLEVAIKYIASKIFVLPCPLLPTNIFHLGLKTIP